MTAAAFSQVVRGLFDTNGKERHLVRYHMLAVRFFPEKLWFMIGVYLAVAGLIIVVSIRAASRFGGTAMWAATGMFIGGMGAAVWYVVLLPIGVVAGRCSVLPAPGWAVELGRFRSSNERAIGSSR